MYEVRTCFITIPIYIKIQITLPQLKVTIGGRPNAGQGEVKGISAPQRGMRIESHSPEAKDQTPLACSRQSVGLNRRYTDAIQPAFCLFVDIRRKRSLFYGRNIFLQVLRVECAHND